MNRTLLISCFVVLGILIPSVGNAQDRYLSGLYMLTNTEYQDYDLNVYDFSRRKSRRTGQIKAKYFAKNANSQFNEWKEGKKILFYCSGAFSESWDPNSPPLGVCVDNGNIVNRNLDSSMDGLVIVYNGGAQAGGIGVVNIDKDPVKVSQGGNFTYDLRNYSQKSSFLNWAASQDATVFQTQLMYTSKYGYGFNESTHLTYGSSAERRFLAICIKDGTVHHIVIDHPGGDYLNRSAKRVHSYLSESMGYNVIGLFNLDTGGKNIMRAYDDEGDTLSRTSLDTDEATNLLVYYVD